MLLQTRRTRSLRINGIPSGLGRPASFGVVCGGEVAHLPLVESCVELLYAFFRLVELDLGARELLVLPVFPEELRLVELDG